MGTDEKIIEHFTDKVKQRLRQVGTNVWVMANYPGHDGHDYILNAIERIEEFTDECERRLYYL